jgi:hypothetical protein
VRPRLGSLPLLIWLFRLPCFWGRLPNRVFWSASGWEMLYGVVFWSGGCDGGDISLVDETEGRGAV